MSPNLRGVAWIVGSCAAGTLMSAGIKELAPLIPVFQIVFLRCLVGLVLTVPMVMFRRAGPPDSQNGTEALGSPAPRWISPRWRLHLLRGALAVGAINCGYYAIAALPLATVTVLFFTAPLFITILAVPFLGEKVGWRRWSATAIGFLGALVVLWPAPGEPDVLRVEAEMLVAILSSVLFAGALITGKKLSTTEAPTTMLLYSGLFTTIGALPLALSVWVTPSWQDLLLLGVVSIFATGRSYCDIRGYAAGEASFVAPFSYLRLIFMGLAGYFLFAEIPEVRALSGAVIIIGSSLYIAHREATHKRRLSKPAVGPSPD
ncbi:MAG: DMT family transporter [Pseudomonadota bacterium]